MKSAGSRFFRTGVIESECGEWFRREFDFEIWRQVGPIVFTGTMSGTEPLKGVGVVCYVAAEIALRG